MRYGENNSEKISRSLSLFQGDVVCFLLINGRYALCQRVLEDLVVLRVDDHPMKDYRPDNTRRDPMRGAVLIDHLLPVFATVWIQEHGEGLRVNFLG